MPSFPPSPSAAVVLLGKAGNAEACGLPRLSEHGCGDDDGRAQRQVVLFQILVCHHCCVWASALLPPWRLQVPLAAVAFPIHVSRSAEPQTPSRAVGALEWEGHGERHRACGRAGGSARAVPVCHLTPLCPCPAGISVCWAPSHLGAGRQMDAADRSFSCSIPGL